MLCYWCHVTAFIRDFLRRSSWLLYIRHHNVCQPGCMLFNSSSGNGSYAIQTGIGLPSAIGRFISRALYVCLIVFDRSLLYQLLALSDDLHHPASRTVSCRAGAGGDCKFGLTSI